MANRISDVAPSSNFSADIKKPEDVENKLITIHSVVWMRGNFGEFVHISASRLAGEEPFTISCGGETVMRQLEAVEQAGAFPVEARFIRHGRMWKLE